MTQWQLVFPHAEVHRLSDAGHFVPEDAPQQLLRYVRDILTSRRRGSA